MRRRGRPDRALLELCRLQGDVCSKEQALGLGLTGPELRGLLDRGSWQRVARGMYLCHNGPIPWRSLVWAGLLTAGDRAAVGGEAAAHLLGLGEEPGRIDYWIGPQTRVRSERTEWNFRRDSVGRSSRARGMLRTIGVEDLTLDICTTASRDDEIVDGLDRGAERSPNHPRTPPGACAATLLQEPSSGTGDLARTRRDRERARTPIPARRRAGTCAAGGTATVASWPQPDPLGCRLRRVRIADRTGRPSRTHRTWCSPGSATGQRPGAAGKGDAPLRVVRCARRSLCGGCTGGPGPASAGMGRTSREMPPLPQRSGPRVVAGRRVIEPGSGRFVRDCSPKVTRTWRQKCFQAPRGLPTWRQECFQAPRGLPRSIPVRSRP